ncbi:hypothetical protein RND71_027719 [Anisodus tanguticus]|uniref:Uncharacterized protein n=1 Tax=Anisodus tanguticus TaxID=243964 RepID=A0AAE1RID5_9SOLA|nr:hypothetical protein RND71_027719 [Anisodus tanguticus]
MASSLRCPFTRFHLFRSSPICSTRFSSPSSYSSDAPKSNPSKSAWSLEFPRNTFAAEQLQMEVAPTSPREIKLNILCNRCGCLREIPFLTGGNPFTIGILTRIQPIISVCCQIIMVQ